MKPNINKAILFFLLLTSLGAHAQTYLISTVAGSGSYGYTGDGGQATAANIAGPEAVAVADSGAFYIVQGNNHVVRKVKPNGIVVTIAGSGTSGYSGDGNAATLAKLSSPADVAVDTAGNIYIADLGNNVVRKVSKAGVITTVAGSSMAGFSGDGGPATAAKLSSPGAVAVDTFGNLYISDMGNFRIRKVNAAGIISTFAGSGTSGFSGDGFAATSAGISAASGIAADRSGNVFVVDQLNNRIRKVNSGGIISTIAGAGTSGYTGDNGPATAATFQYPNKIAVDTKGNLYIGDGNNNVVRKIGVNDTIYTVAGKDSSGFSGDGGIATKAKLSNPRGVAVDTAGKIYIADAGNNRIRRVAKKNTVSVYAMSKAHDLQVFPNPSGGELWVRGRIENPGADGAIHVSVANIMGQTVYEQIEPARDGVLNAHIKPDVDLPPGSYLLSIKSGTIVETLHVVIQR